MWTIREERQRVLGKNSVSPLILALFEGWFHVPPQPYQTPWRDRARQLKKRAVHYRNRNTTKNSLIKKKRRKKKDTTGDGAFLSAPELLGKRNPKKRKKKKMPAADIKDGSILRIWMDTVSRQNISTPCDWALMFNQVWAKSICSVCSQQTTHSARLASLLIIEV